MKLIRSDAKVNDFAFLSRVVLRILHAKAVESSPNFMQWTIFINFISFSFIHSFILNIDIDDYNRSPDDYSPSLSYYNQSPGDYNRSLDHYDESPDDYNWASGDYNRSLDYSDQSPGGFNRSHNYFTVPCDYNRSLDYFSRSPAINRQIIAIYRQIIAMNH